MAVEMFRKAVTLIEDSAGVFGGLGNVERVYAVGANGAG